LKVIKNATRKTVDEMICERDEFSVWSERSREW